MFMTVAWSYFSLAHLFPFIHAWNALPDSIVKNELLWMSITGGLLSGIKILLAVISVKLLKSWYLKQKENEKIEREKLNLDLQLLKAQIRPDLLFSSLDTISIYSQNKDSGRASVLLLKLSELLSYILYESDKPFVALDKEIKMIKDYLLLVKMNVTRTMDIDISVKGNGGDKIIIPLILLPFLENSMAYCLDKNLENSWLNLSIINVDEDLTIKIVNGKFPNREG